MIAIPEGYYSIDLAKKMLGVSPSTISRIQQGNREKFKKVGRYVIVLKEFVDELVENQKKKANFIHTGSY